MFQYIFYLVASDIYHLIKKIFTFNQKLAIIEFCIFFIEYLSTSGTSGDVSVWGMKFSEYLGSTLNIAAGLIESAKDLKNDSFSSSVHSFTLVTFLLWQSFGGTFSKDWSGSLFFVFADVKSILYACWGTIFPTSLGANQYYSLSVTVWELINFAFISVQNKMAAIWEHDFPSPTIQVQCPQITFPFFSAIIQGVKCVLLKLCEWNKKEV